MADDKDKKIGEVPHLENVTGNEKIPVSADGEPRFIETAQIYDKEVTPYPKPNEIVYTTTDGEVIELDDANIVSNIYYKDKGFGVIVFKGDLENLDETPAFQGKNNLLEVIYPDALISLPTRCFADCLSLKYVKFPNALKNCGHSLFVMCKSIELTSFPEGWTTHGWGVLSDSGVSSFYMHHNTSLYDFKNCKQLKSVIFKDTVESIGQLSFTGCTALTDVILPKNLKTIEAGAFNDCPLSRIIIPEGVRTIGDGAFRNTPILYFDTYLPTTQGFPQANRLQTLILRYDGVVKDVDTYASTFAQEPIAIPEASTLDLADSPMPIDGAEPMPILNTYIGTPNNWLKIYVPENRLKEYQETYPTLKSHFHPITGEDVNATNDDAKMQVFIDLWNEACKAEGKVYGKYNEETGFFELNGLTDITYEQAIKIYESSNNSSLNQKLLFKRWQHTDARTLLPIGLVSEQTRPICFNFTFYESSKLESLSFYDKGYIAEMGYAFAGCSSLKRIDGIMDFTVGTDITNIFERCWELETVYIKNAKKNVSFQYCSKLSIDSLKYMVSNSGGDTPITITVHSDIFRQLSDPDNAEWYQLNQDAIDKQITFATI